MKIIATIEARMTSSRLPGKVLLPANNEPLLGHLVQRLKRVESLDEIVLATTTNASDDCLVEFAKDYNISHHRGSEEDVMQRVLHAAQKVSADIIVEITGDCPIIDPNIVQHCVDMYLINRPDYLTNALVDTYPIGMAVQVFSRQTLEKSYHMTSDPLDREHVTRHICQNPQFFKILQMVAPKDCFMPELEVTLDELADYELIKNVVEYFAEADPYFSCQSLIQLITEKRPEWIAINQSVNRKGMDD